MSAKLCAIDKPVRSKQAERRVEKARREGDRWRRLSLAVGRPGWGPVTAARLRGSELEATPCKGQNA